MWVYECYVLYKGHISLLNICACYSREMPLNFGLDVSCDTGIWEKAGKFEILCCVTNEKTRWILNECCSLLTLLSKSQSQSKSTLCYHRRSVCQSALVSASTYLGLMTRFLFLSDLRVCWCGALHLTRGRVSRLPDSVSSNKSLVRMYNLHVTSY
jgi:hypothetical protein